MIDKEKGGKKEMVAKTRTQKDMTKAELIRAIQAKVRNASPILRKGAFSTKNLMRLKKSELQRQLKKARVVASGRFKGDVEFS